jgi:hypothetical protein
MQNTCPGCGAMYNLTQQHVGRSFACKKCNATLVVTGDGLELAGGGGVASGEPLAFAGPESGGSAPSIRRPRGGGASEFFEKFWARIQTDASTWLFGAGAFFVILCLFLPLLDRAKVQRQESKNNLRERKEQRLNAAIQSRLVEAKPEEREKLEKEKKDRDAAFKHWQQEEKPRLEEEVDEARASEAGWTWWYRVGMMWGFFFLAFASLGYLTPEQSLIRRIVGSVIICAMMLLIFIRFVTVGA